MIVIIDNMHSTDDTSVGRFLQIIKDKWAEGYDVKKMSKAGDEITVEFILSDPPEGWIMDVGPNFFQLLDQMRELATAPTEVPEA